MGTLHCREGLRIFCLLSLGPIAIVGLSGATSGFQKENLDLPFDALGESNEEEEAPEIVVFYGQVYEADAVVLALDASGSMDYQGRWTIQTREVLRMVSELTERAEFGLVFYASSVTTFRETTVNATEASKAASKFFVQSRRPNGDTCLAEGVVKALQIAAKSRSKRRTVIVTSDGLPDICSTGDLASGADLDLLIKKTLDANPGRQVKVHTLWVGQVDDAQPVSFMRRLATAHGGTFQKVSG